MSEWMDRWMHRRTDGRMAGWTDGQMDGGGRIGGWIDGRVDGGGQASFIGRRYL